MQDVIFVTVSILFNNNKYSKGLLIPVIEGMKLGGGWGSTTMFNPKDEHREIR